MKILIVGAGITGLSTYLYLRRHLPDSQSLTITIVEAYDTSKIKSKSTSAASTHELSKTNVDNSPATFASAVVGSALGVSANGLNCLRRIDSDGSTKTLDRIINRGALITKWDINCARGWKLAEAKLCPDLGTSEAQKQEDEGLGPALMIVRQALWEELRDAVIELGGKSAIANKRVTDVVVTDDGCRDEPIRLHFADGSEEVADLLIGADGLKSIVRKVMFQDVKETDYITPHYE